MHFHEIKHQARALSILRRTLESGRTHHAYLFDGPDGVGKEMAARALTAKLLCENVPGKAGFQGGLGFGGDEAAADEFEPCGDCRSCRLLAGGAHPDFHLVERGLHKVHPDAKVRNTKGLFLVVDVVRKFLIEPASASPTLGRRRVFLIREAERMNEEAQNALLKTLEEPPGGAVLILVTSAGERLYPTIRSRCQRIPFGTLPGSFLIERLRAAGADGAAAQTLAGLAQGQLGTAIEWQSIGLVEIVERVAGLLGGHPASDPDGFSKAMLEAVGEIAKRRKANAKRLAPISAEVMAELRAAREGVDQDESEDEQEEDEQEDEEAGPAISTDELREALKLGFAITAAILRDALVCRSMTGCGAPAPRAAALRLLSTRLVIVSQLAERASEDQLASRVRGVLAAERLLDRNVSPALACERLALALGDIEPQPAIA